MAGELPRRPFPLVGMRSRDWRKVRCQVSPLDPAQRGRVALVTIRSLLNDLMHQVDERQFGPAISSQRVESPLIVLGLARSGTTLLHQLLCRDPQAAYPTFSQTFNPHTFLTAEGKTTGPLARLARGLNALWGRSMGLRRRAPAAPGSRGIDAMLIGPHTPEEDEFALMMSGLSISLALCFPADPSLFLRFDEETRRAWQRAWLSFLRKLSFRYPDRRLTLKSTHHLIRIPWILELFPDARFIFISREPAAVFRSHLKAIDQLTRAWSFQSIAPSVDPIAWGTSTRWQVDSYLAAREGIRPGNLHELRYEELVADPVETLRQAYDALRLGDFQLFEPHLRQELALRTGYQANDDSVDPGTLQWLREVLPTYHQAFGY